MFPLLSFNICDQTCIFLVFITHKSMNFGQTHCFCAFCSPTTAVLLAHVFLYLVIINTLNILAEVFRRVVQSLSTSASLFLSLFLKKIFWGGRRWWWWVFFNSKFKSSSFLCSLCFFSPGVSEE